jgi:hypothetical protein
MQESSVLGKRGTSVTMPEFPSVPKKAPPNLKSSKTAPKKVFTSQPSQISEIARCGDTHNTIAKKQKVSPVPSDPKQKNELILNQESWGFCSHQRFPEDKIGKKPSPCQEKAFPCPESRDENLIIQKSANPQNSEAPNRSSEKLSKHKILEISELEPTNYDKAHNPIEFDSIFSDKFSEDVDRECNNNKQTTEIQKTVQNENAILPKHQHKLTEYTQQKAFTNETDEPNQQVLELNPQVIFSRLIKGASDDILKQEENRKISRTEKETSVCEGNQDLAHPPPNFPSIIYSKIEFKKHKPRKPKKWTFNQADESELTEIMLNIGYNYAEIQEAIDRKRKKYGVGIKINGKERPPTEEEIKKKQRRELGDKRRAVIKKEMIYRWKKSKKSTF